MKKKPTRGGARPGAGRPKQEVTKQAKTLKLDPEVADYLRTTENQTATVEQAIRRSQGFRNWKARLTD